MTRSIRYAWFEYEDDRDGITFDRVFGAGGLGWSNIFLDLERGPGDARIDNANPSLVIKPYPYQGRPGELGLLAKPGPEHAAFLERWLVNPGLDKAHSKLCWEGFTEQPEIVIVSGHGSSGEVRGDACGQEAGIDVAGAFIDNSGAPSTGALKYLIIPTCANGSFENAAHWLPALQRDRPIHGILGYGKAYPGDTVGAAVMQRFADAVRRDPGSSLLRAWARANEGLDWGAVLLDGADVTDTMSIWTSVGIPDYPANGRVLHYDKTSLASGGREVVVIPKDYEVRFVDPDGTVIDQSNNRAQPLSGPPRGLFAGKPGKIRVFNNSPRDLQWRDVVHIVFYWYRPEHPEMDLERLFAFDPQKLATGKLALLRDFNPQKERDKKPVKTGLADAIRYIVDPGEERGFDIDFTVLPQALAAYPRDGAGATTHGRFYVHFFRPGSDYNDPSMADSMYLHGAFLRE
jgi:hypothetical protein